MGGRDGPRTVARDGPIVCRTRPTDRSPWTVLRAFAGPRVAWAPPDGPTIAGCGVADTVSAAGSARFDEVREGAETLFSALEFAPASGVEDSVPAAARPRLLGGFAFHGGREPSAPWRGFPQARFVLPRIQVSRDDGDTWVTATTAGPDADPEATEAALDTAIARAEGTPETRSPPPGIADVRRTPSREEWREQVLSAVERIEAGELEKVVLAGTLSARLRGPFRLADTLARLAETSPDCYRFAVDPGLGATFFGATPERLVSRRGDRVRTEALAGSIGRGGTAEEDERMTRELTETSRLRHEHDVVAESIRERLAAHARSVEVGDLGVRKLGSVQHLETPITATLGGPTHVLELVESLHPTPAVGGQPRDVARRIIEETESFDRGWYAGPVGWFDAEGDGEFAVGIRSAVATTDEATLYAGNGIVRDSDPDEEWDELQLKYRPILDQLRA